MRIVHVSSEVAPFSKTGGLADVVSSLPAALEARGHRVTVITPRYDLVDLDRAAVEAPESLQDLSLEIGEVAVRYSVLGTKLPGTDVAVYLVDCPSAYARGAVYTSDRDEHLRFVILQRAALEIVQRLGLASDVIHCHDWQTGLIPLYLKTLYAWDSVFARTRTVLTIHNLGYQGTFPAAAVPDTGLDVCAHLLDQHELGEGRFGFLRTGIAYADALTTVSPTYAREILSPAAGLGLDGLLRERAYSLVGILNGIDTAVWNPATDVHLPYRYSAKSLWRKEKNKESLLGELGLDYHRGVPVFGLVARMAWQKGIGLMHEALPPVLASRDVRLLALGSGEREHMEFFRALQARFPRQVAYRSGYAEPLAHRIEAAADAFLMPSLYEPCGLNQMYSQAYGTVPIVHRTGGLADSVTLWDPDSRQGTGIVFDHPTVAGLSWAMGAALRLYEDRDAWGQLVANAMAQDNSWEHRVQRYETVYGGGSHAADDTTASSTAS